MPLFDSRQTRRAGTGRVETESEDQAQETTPRPRTSGSEPALIGKGLLNRMAQRAELLAPDDGGEADVELTGYARLRDRVKARVRQTLRDVAGAPRDDVVRRLIAGSLEDILAESNVSLPRQERARLIETVTQDMLGLGPLDDLLADPTVDEIMVNGPRHIYVERDNRMMKSDVVFESEAQLMQVIDRIVARVGRRIDESSPMVDARLDDGSRVHIIIPPLSLTGATITIRRFAKIALTATDLVANGTCTQEMLDFIRACVMARLNIAVSGGGSSGKTTTLNVLSSFIPSDERIVTIEDAAELQLAQVHVVPLESRPANVEGRGKVTIRDLVINTLRMRPDRIVVGECRGGEALDMLQAMNTGHDGSLTTLHANSAKEALARIETMVLMAGTVLPSRAIREQIGSAINVIIHQSRLRDGTRKVTSITEVTGCIDGEIRYQDIFRYEQTGIADDGSVIGYHTATGVTPYFLEHINAFGQELPAEMFVPAVVPAGV